MKKFYYLYQILNELLILVYTYDTFYFDVKNQRQSLTFADEEYDYFSVRNNKFLNEITHDLNNPDNNNSFRLFNNLQNINNNNEHSLLFNESNLAKNNNFPSSNTTTMVNNTNSTTTTTTTTKTLNEQNNSILDELEKILNIYYLPTIVIIGILGNALTIIILSQENKLLQLYNAHYSTRKHLLTKMHSTINNDFCTNQKPNLAKSCSMRDIYQASLSKEKPNQFKRQMSSNQQFSPTNYFIFSLAVSDLCYNLILLLVWITNMGVNVVNREFFCQLSVITTYICSFLSATFTTLFTFQRFMAVVKPLRSATSFSLQSTNFIRRLIIFLFVFSILLYSYSIFLHDSNEKRMHESQPKPEKQCGIKEGLRHMVFTLDNTVDAFFTLIIPSISIFCMNIAICRSLTKYQKENILNEQSSSYRINSNAKVSKKAHQINCEEAHSFRNSSGQDESPKNERSPIKSSSVHECLKSAKQKSDEPVKSVSYFSIDTSKVKQNGLDGSSLNVNNKSPRKKILKQEAHGNNESKPHVHNNHHQHQTASSRRVTKTLLVVSFSFLLLNSPYRTANLISFIIMSIKGKNEFSQAEYAINMVLLNLYFTSYSLNFFLYSLWGRKFRDSLKALFFYCFFVVYKKIQNIPRDLFKRK